ncbi:hypothetical protein [Natronosalvus amylolyticus]|uniref:hypothetical protein n=1 Tax=Natronosalvus amylolyticus TaxID=2961994 RepID=UPI0020C980AB|nr:hypothetical protein [Natronosalvus amylolyticus]
MSVEIETPYPVTGEIELTPYGYSLSLPCETEWITEHENGDLAGCAAADIRRQHGVGATVEVTWRANGRYDIGAVTDKSERLKLEESPIDTACIETNDGVLLKVDGNVVETDQSAAKLLANEIIETLELHVAGDSDGAR